jgi:hypothetical protein
MRHPTVYPCLDIRLPPDLTLFSVDLLDPGLDDLAPLLAICPSFLSLVPYLGLWTDSCSVIMALLGCVVNVCRLGIQNLVWSLFTAAFCDFFIPDALFGFQPSRALCLHLMLWEKRLLTSC